MSDDSRFTGSIPATYDELLVPVLFRPFAADLVARVRDLAPASILELAAGTGVVSHLLAASLPQARIVATDLNPAMLEIASSHGTSANLSFEPADAQHLPFADDSFDLVVAQFGAMFFPDRIGAFREALRVLGDNGTLLFNVWDRLEANTGSAAIHDAVRSALPDPKPDFIARTPFGYNDRSVIKRELQAAGFAMVDIAEVVRTGPPGSAPLLARGICQGTPLANELALHSPSDQDNALEAATSAAEALEADGPLLMTALVVTASPAIA